IRDYKVTGVQTCALPICIAGRVSLLEQFDQQRRLFDVGRIANPSAENRRIAQRESAFDRFRQRALGLVMSEKTRRALDIRQESEIGRASCRERMKMNVGT